MSKNTVQCNLKASGIRLRTTLGVLGALAGSWATLLYFFGGASELDLLLICLIFMSASASATGFIQARTGFCAAFGLMGIEETTDSGSLAAVKAEARKQQAVQAIKLLLYSTLIGFAVTVTVYFVKLLAIAARV